MGLSEEVEKKLLKQHNEICKTLNLDKCSASEAWKSLIQISDSYILEGEPLHWLGCTLYIACKSSFTPTVSRPNVVIQGNLVSLTKLLRVIDLSLIDFFLKMKKCSDLLNLSEDFKEHMEKLEKNFNVSMVLFRKFQPIFSDVFRMENSDVQKPGSKAKKLKTHPPSCWRIMDFTWTLFICVKANVSNITDDLVNSYHLLLACIDFVYANVYESGRKEMLKLGISSTPERVNATEMSHLPCIVDYLCKTHDGIIIDVKSMKEYCLRQYVRKLFESHVIKGNYDLLTGVMEFTTFELNLKDLGKLYEEYTLSLGGVDERVFLGYSSNMCNIGNFGAFGGNAQEIGEQIEVRRKQNFSSQIRNGPPLTPLSGRRYLQQIESHSPVTGNNSFSLHSSLMARDSGPSEYTLKIIKNCPKEPILVSTVDALCKTLQSKLLAPSANNPEEKSAVKDIRNIPEMSGKLFYKFLDSILPEETKKPTFDPNVMLNNEQLIKALFACAAELVLDTCKIRKFPWILDALSIPPYYCYKVIEVIVKYEDLLTRDLVKHLSSVEESILESLAWSSTSPLWKALIDSNQPVPSCEDVVQEGAVEYTEVTRPKVGGIDKLEELASKSSILTHSPGAPLADKFMSPIKGKRPHSDNDANGPSPKRIAFSKPDGMLQMETGDRQENGRTDPLKITKENKRPKRTGSTSLFFRKFYHLAVVRMLDLCDQLGLSDLELRRKIWTCFELTIVNHVGLMCNRHLDQLLMCSIYVICKIVDSDPKFVNMMKCYRNQPQAQWHVYRQVLINPDRNLEEIKRDLDDPPQTVEERGDIIRFYNEVFIHKVKELTKRFRLSADNERIVLSPILVGKSTPVNGPRRVSEKHPLYLRALLPRSPNSGNQLHYHFSRSPAKDLHAINSMVCKAEYKKPKILKEDPEHHSNSISQKVKDMYADRISLNKQEMESQK